MYFRATSQSHLARCTRIQIWKRDHTQQLPSPQDYDRSQHLQRHRGKSRLSVPGSAQANSRHLWLSSGQNLLDRFRHMLTMEICKTRRQWHLNTRIFRNDPSNVVIRFSDWPFIGRYWQICDRPLSVISVGLNYVILHGSACWIIKILTWWNCAALAHGQLLWPTERTLVITPEQPWTPETTQWRQREPLFFYHEMNF